MEATPAVTLHLPCLERQSVAGLTGPAEGEDPKCLRHTWLRAKLQAPPPVPSRSPFFYDTSECLCELLYFLIFLTFMIRPIFFLSCLLDVHQTFLCFDVNNIPHEILFFHEIPLKAAQGVQC